jgi:hypothetical protein
MSARTEARNTVSAKIKGKGDENGRECFVIVFATLMIPAANFPFEELSTVDNSRMLKTT